MTGEQRGLEPRGGGWDDVLQGIIADEKRLSRSNPAAGQPVS